MAIQNSDISPVKHTEGGMMPEVSSRFSEIGRRVRSVAPVITDRQNLLMYGVPVMLLGVGAYFYFRRGGQNFSFQDLKSRIGLQNLGGNKEASSTGVNSDQWMLSEGESNSPSQTAHI